MPKFGSAEVGAVGKWYVKEGVLIETGDIIAEIESEKVTTELESPVAGRVGRLLVDANADVPVGTVIVEIAEQKP